MRVKRLTQTGGFLEVVVVNVLVGWFAVEEEEDNGLEGGHYELLITLGELGFELAVREGVLEFEFAAGMLGLVVCFELINR
jgi:hypothetical protein